jgi:hypothetical protein
MRTLFAAFLQFASDYTDISKSLLILGLVMNKLFPLPVATWGEGGGFALPVSPEQNSIGSD